MQEPQKTMSTSPAIGLPGGFSVERANRYAEASNAVPSARDAELTRIRETLDRLGRKDFKSVLEIGVGQGFGTSVLLEYLAKDGSITGVDASEHMASRVANNKHVKIHVGALDALALEKDSIDFAFSLAAFHHIPNKYLVLQEIKRLLQPGALFLIVDVNHETQAQEIFDYVVRLHCVTGHDADFLDSKWVKLLAERSGMEHISSKLEAADWLFEDEAEMVRYVRDLFCLELSIDDVEMILRPWLEARSDKKIFPWSLGFHLLRKPS